MEISVTAEVLERDGGWTKGRRRRCYGYSETPDESDEKVEDGDGLFCDG